MSRPKKTGLTYYNINTDVFLNRKIKRLIKNFGGNGYMIYSYVLTEIYRDKGCFIAWDLDTAFDVSDVLNVKETLVNEVVSYCCNVGLFNKELRTSENVLTTENIQEFWLRVVTSAGRAERDIPDKINLLKLKTQPKEEESTLNKGETTPKEEESTQSKVNESKVNESKVNKTREDITALDFLKNSNEFDYSLFEMQNKKNVKDWDRMLKNFNYKVEEEGLVFEVSVLKSRLMRWMDSWIANENKGKSFNSSQKTGKSFAKNR